MTEYKQTRRKKATTGTVNAFFFFFPGPGDEAYDTPKSRRSLQFATPKSKTTTTSSDTTKNKPSQKTCDLDSSCLSAALNISVDSLNNTILSEDEVDGAVEEVDQSTLHSGTSLRDTDSQMQKKRSARETEQLDAEAENFFDSLPDLGKATLYLYL